MRAGGRPAGTERELLLATVSLAWKIVLSAALPVGLLIAASTVSFRSLDAAGTAPRRALSRVAPVVREAAAAEEDLATLSRLHGRWSTFRDPAYEQVWARRAGRLDAHVRAMATWLETPPERRSLAKATTAIRRYRTLTADEDGGTVALRLLSPAERPQALRADARARRALVGVGRALDATARATEAQAGVAERKSRATMRGAIGLAASLALLLSSWTAIQLVRRLRRLAYVSEALERGRLDEPVAIGGRDELGRLGVAFEALAHELRERDRVGEDLVRRLGHDLGEPLQTVRDIAHALAGELAHDGTSQQRRLAATIGDVTEHLLDRVAHLGEVSHGVPEIPHARPAPLGFDRPALLPHSTLVKDAS
jgi:hypothetical protein